MLRYLPFLLVLALWIYAFIDCLNTPESQVRGLPKVVWVLIILLFGEVLIGPIAWLAAGKQRHRVAGGGGSTPAEWHRNHSGHPGGKWLAPDDNPEFLRSLREENKKDEALLKDWEADLRRREEELRRKESGASGGGTGAGGAGSSDGNDRTSGKNDRKGPEDTPPTTA
ncbi:PLD nuclease N-terminal domain-containing protein [Streptomyces sp. NPDC058000]|uniref:PLD nuclease N-terminal domain-containing protein n=1 Tax=Streptomyces sp. NPDC058000 TaxID=3346299 RepID=UPI0036EED017